MSDPYIYFGRDPAGDPEVAYLLIDAQGAGRLRPSQDVEGKWVLRCVAPASYEPVSFTAHDVEDAKGQAIDWVEAQPELLAAFSADDEDD